MHVYSIYRACRMNYSDKIRMHLRTLTGATRTCKKDVNINNMETENKE